MKAIVLSERGRAGVALREMPRPDCPPGSVRVRMVAASVNRVDLYMRDSGAGITHSLPQIMGVDGAGTVIEFTALNTPLVINQNVQPQFASGTLDFTLV